MFSVVELLIVAVGVVHGDHTATNFLRTSAGPVATRFPHDQFDSSPSFASEESALSVEQIPPTALPGVPPGLNVQQQKSFTEFCVELIRNSTDEAQRSGGGRGSGSTVAARTVGDDGTIISVENNPEGVNRNTVQVSPVIFNIADVNLVVMEKGMALFLPLDQVPIQDMLNGAGAPNGGLQLLLQPDKMPPGLSDCMVPQQFSG